MAMSKKEQAEFAKLQAELASAKAFRFTAPVSRDLLPPDTYSELSRGWDYNAYSRTVSKACSSSIHHGDGWERTSSQRPRSLYSTEARAWAALRNQLEQDYSRNLAEIDAALSRATGEGEGHD